MPVLIALLILSLLLAGAGYFFARKIVYPNVFPWEETLRRTVEWGHFKAEEYNAWEKETFTLTSSFGYTLYGVYHPYPGANKTLVLTHGITWSLYGMVKYALLFRRRGWNLLLWDLRFHGRSGGRNTTFGAMEKYDLKQMVDEAFRRLPPGGIVATLGESLGAATTLQHAGIDDRIAFAIADCPYSDLTELLAYRLKVEYHLPRFPLLPLAQLFARPMAGLTFAQASPIRAVETVEAPILLIHGKADDYIPPKMSLDLYRAKTHGLRQIYLAPNAAHAEALVKNPVEYDQQVELFLQSVAAAGRLGEPK